MGLIVENVTVVTPSVVSSTATVISPAVMDAPIVDHTANYRVCTDGSSSSMSEDTGSFDKSIYRVFSMQDDMKTLTYNGRPRNEFEQFLEDAESKTAGLGYNTTFDSLDSYLGSVGVVNEVC